MTEPSFDTQRELDRLLNDPDVLLQPSRVWDLLDELARGSRARPALRPILGPA